MSDGLQLSPDHRGVLEALLREYLPDVEVWAYGRRVNGRSHEGSDLDLTLRGLRLEKIPAERLAEFEDAVRDSAIPFRVAARDWSRLPALFRREIEQDHVGFVDPLPPSDDWPVLTLHDAGVRLIDCIHKTPAARESGYPYIAIPQMKSGRLDFESARRISHEDFLYWTKKARPQPHDVVLSRRTNPGVTAIDRTGTAFALGQNLVLLRADGSRVEPAFLKWLVRSPAWWREIGKYLNVGALFDSLRCADVPNFELPIPPLRVQHRTGALLDALDDKIELNRRMNETLEAMARALFKSWFVDFEPVRAKIEGRDTGLPDHVAELFPSRFHDEGLPAGWRLSQIGREVRIVGGATPRTTEPAFWDGGEHHWATPKDLSRLPSPVLLNTDRKITDAGVDKISSGLLPVGTVLMSSRAPIGYLAIAGVPTAVNQGFMAMICTGLLPNIFVLFWCEQQLGYIKGVSGGSTFAEISKQVFRAVPVVIPPAEILLAYSSVVGPIFDRLVANSREAISLARTRDLLLPKLISGVLRVPDSERIAAAVI